MARVIAYLLHPFAAHAHAGIGAQGVVLDRPVVAGWREAVPWWKRPISRKWAIVPLAIVVGFVLAVVVPAYYNWHINRGASYGDTFRGVTWTHEATPTPANVKVGANITYSRDSRDHVMKRVCKLSSDGGWVWVMGDSAIDGASSGSYEDGWLRLPWSKSQSPSLGRGYVVEAVVDRYFSLGDFRSRFEKDLLFRYGPSAIHWNADRKVVAVQDGETIRLLHGSKTVKGHFFKWLDGGAFQIITTGRSPRAYRVGLDGKRLARIVCPAEKVGFVGSGVRAIAFDGFVEVAKGDTIVLPTHNNLAVKVVGIKYNRLPNEMGMNTVAEVDRDITPTPPCYGQPVRVRRG